NALRKCHVPLTSLDIVRRVTPEAAGSSPHLSAGGQVELRLRSLGADLDVSSWLAAPVETVLQPAAHSDSSHKLLRPLCGKAAGKVRMAVEITRIVPVS